MDEFITMNEFADLLAEKRPDILEEMAANEPEYQIARSIIAARLRLKWSQQKLAERAKLTQTQVSRLEIGIHGRSPKKGSKAAPVSRLAGMCFSLKNAYAYARVSTKDYWRFRCLIVAHSNASLRGRCP